jgi:hypothetical protein
MKPTLYDDDTRIIDVENSLNAQRRVLFSSYFVLIKFIKCSFFKYNLALKGVGKKSSNRILGQMAIDNQISQG